MHLRIVYACRTSSKIRILISACNESASRSHFWCRRSGSRGTWALPTQSSEACQFKSFCSRGGNPFATASSSREAKKKVNTYVNSRNCDFFQIGCHFLYYSAADPFNIVGLKDSHLWSILIETCGKPLATILPPNWMPPKAAKKWRASSFYPPYFWV